MMKKMTTMTTIKAALAAVRTGFAVTAMASESEAVEVIFSGCFPKSGHVFYTCRFYGMAFSGFLHPEDTFELTAVMPQVRIPYGDDWLSMASTNWTACASVEAHAVQHQEAVARLLDKKTTFCPSRLRKFRE